MVEFLISRILSDERVLPLISSDTPWWIWSRDGLEVLAANSSAARFMGAVGGAITAKRSYSPDHPFAKQIAALTQSLNNKSQETDVHLSGIGRQSNDTHPFKAALITTTEGVSVVLVQAVEQVSSQQAAVQFIRSFTSSALFFDENGAPLVTSVKARALESLTLSDLLARDYEEVLKQLNLLGKAEYGLSTGLLKIHALKNPPSLVAFIEDAPLPAPEDLPKPKANGLTLAVNNPHFRRDDNADDKLKLAEKILGDVLDFVPPKVKREEPAPILYASDSEDMRISGSMPAPPASVNIANKKRLRFVWSSNETHILTQVSPELAEIIGHSAANIVGQSWHDLIKTHFTDKDGVIAAHLTRRDTWSGHIVAFKVENEPFEAMVDLAALPVFDKIKGFQGYRGFGVLKEYRALNAGFSHQLNEAELKNFNEIAAVLKPKKAVLSKTKVPQVHSLPLPLMDDLPVAVVIYLGNTVFHVNKPFLAWTGFTSIEEFELAGGMSRLFAASQLDEGQKPHITTKSGEILDVGMRLHKTVWDKQSALAMVLERSKQVTPVSPLPNLLNLTRDAMVMVSEDLKIIALNNHALRLFPSQKGKSIYNLFAAQSQITVKDYVSSLSENGVPSLNEEGREVVVNNETHTPMHLTLHHYEEDEAKYVAVLHDITHLKQAVLVNDVEMKALSQQLAQKNMFVAGISHEIRTPLNAIIGFSEAIIEERFGALQPTRYKAYVEDIKTAGIHILSLVNDLLDLSKLEAGQHEFEVKPLDVNSLFEASVKLIEPQALSAKVMVRKAYTRPLPQVLTDERALKQVLVNLLANAVKFTPSHGQIIVSTLQNELGEVVLRVRDTGKGMSEQELSRSMKPYMSSTDDKSGTGLGLPLVKALVEGLKAKLLITSHIGQGTLVEITFPQSRILV